MDDHPLIREGLRAVLAAEPDLELAGTAATGAEAASLVEELDPQVVLMDIGLPDADGIELTRDLVRDRPHLVVIMVTVHEGQARLGEALRAGARGFLSKGATHRLISRAIRCAVEGGVAIEAHLLGGILHQDSITPQIGTAGRLSSRELEVLTRICKGYANKQISAELDLAESTVKKYVNTLMSKLGASDRAHAASLGIKLGIVR